MRRIEDVAELGIGIVYFSEFIGTIDTSTYDVLEIEPQTFWIGDDAGNVGANRGLLETLGATSQRAVVHSVGLPVGGSVGPDPAHIKLLAENVAALRAPYASEHLSFNRVPIGAQKPWAGFLLPPPQTADGVAVAVRRIEELRESLNVPLAFETGVNYFRARAGDMSDGEFFSAVARNADCGILLDLHNLYANQRNGRQSIAQAIAQLPLERVWEVHLAGGHEFRGYYLDAHDGLISEELRNIAEAVVPRLPSLRTITFEAHPASLRDVGSHALAAQREWLASLWVTRGTRAGVSDDDVRDRLSAFEDARASVASWERDIYDGITRAAECRTDPTFGLLRELIDEARGGAITRTARLSSRLLLATLGATAFQEIVRRYCAAAPAQMLPAQESRAFLAFVEQFASAIPHFAEIKSFELALREVILTREQRDVRFHCNPGELLSALLERKRPQIEDWRAHTVRIKPNGVEIMAR